MTNADRLRRIIRKYHRINMQPVGYTDKYLSVVRVALVLAREVQARRNRYGILRARYATDALLKGQDDGRHN